MRKRDEWVRWTSLPSIMQSPAELEGALDKLTISPDSEQQQPHAHAHPPEQQDNQAHDTQETSQEDVWYLKTIDFTSPSGTTRSYNIITQNYNGCVVRRLRWCMLTKAKKAVFIHRDMQHIDSTRTDRNPSPRPQKCQLRVPSPTPRRAHPTNCARGGRVRRTVNDAPYHQ